MSVKPRAGCEPCRVRHLKCDQITPECGRCRSTGRECVRNYNYRFHRERFADDQKWLRMPRSITFIDETRVIQSEYNGETEFEGALTSQEQNENPTFHYPSSSPTLFAHQAIPTPNYSPLSLGQPVEPTVTPSGPIESLNTSLSPLSGGISAQASHLHHGTPLPTLHDLANVAQLADENQKPFSLSATLPQSNILPTTYHYDENADLRSQIYLDHPVWPLTDPSEALLLRHYVQNLATWLDLCDPFRHFEVTVPRRSGICPILLNAILALSSRHLSQIGSYDPFASNRYHQECLKYLIPMLNHTATISDETLFAATIVLRVLEEIDLPTTGGNDSEGHMLGIQVFVSARDPYSTPGSLSEAAFWVGLRQEIYIATVNHKSIKIKLEGLNEYRSINPTDDFSWANRAVLYCADVLNFCFGEGGLGVDDFRQLRAHGESWARERPETFNPTYFKEATGAEGEVFPQIWFNQGCYIISIQHHLLAVILLAIFDPLIPRVGPGRKAAVKTMEEQTRANLRTMCGIALYNRWTPPGMFTACMGIAICGDRFSNRIEQEALLKVLVQTEEDHARPTTAVQQQMMRSWGWIEDEGE